MNAEKSRGDALNKLEASLNSIFTSIGSVFHNVTPQDSTQKLAVARTNVHSEMPKAVNDLNNSLDILSGDLTRMKAILTRDLQMYYSESDPAEQSSVKVETDQSRNSVQQEQENVNSQDSAPDGDLIPDHMSDADAVLIDVKGVPQHDAVPELPSSPLRQQSSIDTMGGEAIVVSDSKETSKSHPQSSFNGGNDNGAVPASNTSGPGQEGPKKTDDTGSIEMTENDPAAEQPPTTTEELKDDQGEPSPGDDFTSLLPGLDMYANDPSGDGMGAMDGFDTMDVDLAPTADYGNPDDGNNLGGEVNFDDLISFDNGGGEGDGQGELDEFNENFFNIGAD